jgi:hypothetical protein
MRLVVDTDAFCKLALAELLSDCVALFGAEIEECGRLPALPHMLRRGSLPRSFGEAACKRLIPIAERMPTVRASHSWLEKLAAVTAIDPGEAILFSAAAEEQLPVISGDLRALRALKDIEGFPDTLAGRVVIPEAVLLALCHRIGPDVLRVKLEPVRDVDAVIGICFSPGSAEPAEGLRSYFRERNADLAPLVLWEPHTGADS